MALYMSCRSPSKLRYATLQVSKISSGQKAPNKPKILAWDEKPGCVEMQYQMARNIIVCPIKHNLPVSLGA